MVSLQIHIEDLVEVYKLVFTLEAGNSPLAFSPYSRFYYVTSEDVPAKRAADAYAKALLERAKPESVKITYEDGGLFALYAHYIVFFFPNILTDALLVAGSEELFAYAAGV